MVITDNDPINNEHHDLLFSVRRSVRYHNRRRRFYDMLGSTCDALTAIMGSSSVASFFGNFTTFATLSAIFTAIFSASNIIFSFRIRAREHHDFSRKFFTLEKELMCTKLTSQLLTEVTSKRLDIEAEEPPILRLLDLDCHNELVRALDLGEENTYPIKRLHKLIFHFCDCGIDNVLKAKVTLQSK